MNPCRMSVSSRHHNVVNFKNMPAVFLKADTGGSIEFGASDPRDTYGDLVPVIVYENTTDFRPTYFYRKVRRYST